MSENKKKILFMMLAVVAGVIVAFIPPPADLDAKAMWTLGLLVWAIVNWITKSIPDFAVVLIMVSGWVVLGILPFNSAFGAFSGSTIWLLIGVFAISAAVVKSGLLKRASLVIMRMFPPTFGGQVAALMGTGLVIGPAIPSSMAKISIAGPMAAGIGETLGLKPQSKGMAGIFLAMYTGFSLLAPVFISASFFGYMIHGLMPDNVQAQFTWTYWFLTFIPWAIVVVVLSYFAITKIYKPEEKTVMTKDVVKKQLAD